MAAARFLRAGRLSLEQCHPVERSFGILRRLPNIATLSTKAGNSKKPIRYTSIKKAKPKTVIDIGQLILQRANESKGNKQSVIAEAALKAASQAPSPSASKQNAPEVRTAEVCSSAVTFAPPAVNGELRNPITKFSDSMDSRAICSSPTSKMTKKTVEFCEGTTSVGKRVPEYESLETTPGPAVTENFPPAEASGFSELSHTVKSIEASVGKMMKSTAAFNFGTDDTDEIAPDAAEIVDSINMVTATNVVLSEIVGPSPFSTLDIPSASDVLISEHSTPANGSTEATPTSVTLETVTASGADIAYSELLATSDMSSPKEALVGLSVVSDAGGIPEHSSPQTEGVPGAPLKASVVQNVKSPDPVNIETAAEESRTEEGIPSDAQLDPVQRLFIEKIREYSAKARDGPPDAGSEYEKAFAEEVTKLQRLYGNGDLAAFPDFKFPEPILDETTSQ